MKLQLNKSKTYLSYYFNKHIPIKFVKQFLNTYLVHDGLHYCWCMLYKFSGKLEFTNYEYELENSPYYIKTVDVDKHHVLYVFNIPTELDDVITTFINGKYSKLPERKELIRYLYQNFGLPLDSNITKILNRDASIRKKLEEELDVEIDPFAEVSSAPDMEAETFNYDLINAEKN